MSVGTGQPWPRRAPRRRVVADVTSDTLPYGILKALTRAKLMTDEYTAYRWVKRGWTVGHRSVRRRTFEYARGDVHVNTAESSHAPIMRGLVGIHHNISREYLLRCLWQFDSMWNNRQANDGERTVAVIKSSEGERLMYTEPLEQQREYITNREQQKKYGQFEPF